MKLGNMVAAATMLFAIPAAAEAQTALNASNALAIIQGCATHATAQDQSHGIAVVDSGGHVVAALRMNGNGWGIQAFAEEKARAAAAWGFATSGMATAVARTPGFGNAPAVVAVGGGVPIYDEAGNRLGGVGASGEPPEDDEACAIAGIAAAGLRHERPQ